MILTEEITLIKSSPGGSRAHAIIISRDGSYSYKVGEFKDSDLFSDENHKQDTSYQKLDGHLSEAQKLEVQKFIDHNNYKKQLNKGNPVKDAWQYHLFIGNRKVFMIYAPNLPGEAKDVQELIKLIIALPAKLYDLPGFS